MWECIFEHQNPKSFQGPLAGPGPRPQNARFARSTPLRYVGNFRPQKLGPPWPNPGSAPASPHPPPGQAIFKTRILDNTPASKNTCKLSSFDQYIHNQTGSFKVLSSCDVLPALRFWRFLQLKCLTFEDNFKIKVMQNAGISVLAIQKTLGQVNEQKMRLRSWTSMPIFVPTNLET